MNGYVIAPSRLAGKDELMMTKKRQHNGNELPKIFCLRCTGPSKCVIKNSPSK